MELEAQGIALGALGGPPAGLVLTDFGNAFPSLSREFLVFVLGKMGIPGPALAWWAATLVPSECALVFARDTSAVIVVARGVRQGCPAAMALFVAALDPLFRFVCESALEVPASIARAYADDLGFAVRDLLLTLPKLQVSFALVGRAATLFLKIKKCWIIP
eukprot:11224556-Lingulodinium_polyedra.AAC.1